jgi:hypothetical protein
MTLNLGIYGLAWAQSIVAAVEVMILFAIMSFRIPQLFDAVFFHAIARMVSATGFMAIVTYATVNIFALNAEDQSFMNIFPKFSIIVLASFAAYVAVCRLMSLHEASLVTSRLRKMVFDPYRSGSGSYKS